MLFFASSLLLACAEPEVEATPSLGVAEHVVVLVIDGVRIDESFGDGVSTAADGVPTADLLPRIRAEILPHGTLVRPAYNLGVTITASAHASFLTGAPNGFGNFPPAETSGAYFPDLPTLFELVRGQYEADADHVALLGNTTLLDGVGRSTYPGMGASVGTTYQMVSGDENRITDDDVMDEVKSLLSDHPSRLVVANLHHADQMGHYGDLASDYADAVRAQDAPIADFWKWLQKDERLGPSTALILVADHGRHRNGNTEDYRQHGDSCAGCREIPMLLAGAGIAEGVVIDDTVALSDLSATIATLLGIDLPYGVGRVINEADSGPVGDILPVAAGGWTLAQAFATGEQRSVISSGGEIISTSGAFAAEAPRVAESAGDSFACWRELFPLSGTTYPWVPRCIDRSLVDIPPPLPEVPSTYEPALAVGPAGEPWMAVTYNLNGAVDGDPVYFLRYDGTKWQGLDQGPANEMFPSTPTLAVSGPDALVGYAVSADSETGRETRHVELYRVEYSGGTQTWTQNYSSLGIDPDFPRQERPVVSVDGDAVRLAFLGISDSESGVFWVESTDGGATFGSATRLDDSGRVFTHMPPAIYGGRVLWAELGDSEAQLCASDAGCVDLGSADVNGFAPTETGAVVSVRNAAGDWELISVAI